MPTPTLNSHSKSPASDVGLRVTKTTKSDRFLKALQITAISPINGKNMSNKAIGYLAAFWLVSLGAVLLTFRYPTFTWTPHEVARDRIYE